MSEKDCQKGLTLASAFFLMMYLGFSATTGLAKRASRTRSSDCLTGFLISTELVLTSE